MKNIWVKIEGNYRKVYTYKTEEGFTLKVWPKSDNPSMEAAGFKRSPFVIFVEWDENGELVSWWEDKETMLTPESRTCGKIYAIWFEKYPAKIKAA